MMFELDWRRILYESSPLIMMGPVWSSVMVGYSVIHTDGCLYMTREGERYLKRIEQEERFTVPVGLGISMASS